MAINAQKDTGHCYFGHMNHINGFETNHSRFKKQEALLADEGQVFIIPVVVHIIENGGNEANISNALVQTQIDVLNEDYGRFGAGFSNHPLSNDTKIQFCLAKSDPSGNPSTGITRHHSSFTNLQSDDDTFMKRESIWDPRRYLNIWTVRSIDGGSQTQGYAYRPSTSALNTHYDGLVLNYRFFGRNNPYSPTDYKEGHTATHEIGHYFNLVHPWGGDEQGQGGCDDDDGIDDTPDCDGPFYSRKLLLFDSCETPFQCGSYRLIQDFMDYSTDPCLELFTPEQTVVMRQAILKYRPGLVVYANSIATGCGSVYRKLNPPVRNTMEIHPNPAYNTVYLFPYLKTESSLEVFLVDALGRIAYRSVLDHIQADKVPVDISGLRNGFYIIYVKSGDNIWQEKLIKANGL